VEHEREDLVLEGLSLVQTFGPAGTQQFGNEGTGPSGPRHVTSARHVTTDVSFSISSLTSTQRSASRKCLPRGGSPTYSWAIPVGERERARSSDQDLVCRFGLFLRPRAEKLEARAEEIVDAYLKAGVDQGDWRALDALVNRVYGKPTEHIVSEPVETPVQRYLRGMSTEQLEEFFQARRHLRPVEDEAAEEAV
jgi:hypothetical protein